MEKEIWKDIPGYEGLYQASNLGRIKSLWFNKEKILAYGYNMQGYRLVNLCKNNKRKTYAVHKLVANAFLPNFNNYPCINHINGIKTDNRLKNLERCTYSHNNKEAYRIGLKKSTLKGKTGAKCKNSKKVNQYDLDDNFIKQWDSLADVQRELKICAINISRVCRGMLNKAGGFKWRYPNE